MSASLRNVGRVRKGQIAGENEHPPLPGSWHGDKVRDDIKFMYMSRYIEGMRQDGMVRYDGIVNLSTRRYQVPIHTVL